MSTEPQVRLLSMIPAWTISRVSKKKVIETSFATGPGFCAGKVEQHNPPISFEQGLEWLERYREHLKGGAIILVDRSIVWFRWGMYTRYQIKPAKELPEPGIEIPDDEIPWSKIWDDITDPRAIRQLGFNRRGDKLILKGHDGEPDRVMRKYTEQEMERIRARKRGNQ